MSSSSSWSTKLEKKLAVLADTASRESIQTVAKWIGFNRKYAEAFASSLVEAFRKASSSSSRQWLLMQVVHEVLLLEANTAKWERFSELRNVMGEQVLITILQQKVVNVSIWMEKFQTLLNQWEEKNVWHGPTLITQIRALATKVDSNSTDVITPTITMATDTTLTTSVPLEAIAPAPLVKEDPSATISTLDDPSPPAPAEIKVEDTSIDEHIATPKAGDFKEEDSIEKVEHHITSIDEAVVFKKEGPPTAIAPDNANVVEKTETVLPEITGVDSAKPTTTTTEAVDYDFESKGIPLDTVEAREFLEPCKAIATLQIARDLRNDGFAQLSSILSAIPENIREHCRQAKLYESETGEKLEVDVETTREFSKQLSDKFLDLDMDEQLQSIRTFRELVEKQHIERQKLIHLLIKSRCQFGAKEAAEAFFRLDETAQKLQKRKELISDAMALEGLDSEEVPATKEEAEDKELEPLTWYEEIRTLEATANKRAKTS